MNCSMARRWLSAGRGGLLTAAVAMLTAGTGLAAEPTEEILVTGSRIERPEIQATSNLITISDQAIRLEGAVSMDQVLNTIPQTIPGAFSSTTNNGGDGTSSVDLRGLGEERTLVLVDGKRFIPKDETLISDLNALPLALVERVDVITGGASAVYGSDAIAGVVNVILKQDFEGVQFDAGYDTYADGDGDTVNLSLVLGANTPDGKGNVTAYAGFTDREAVLSSDRDYASVALGSNDDLTGLIALGSPSAFPGNLIVLDPALDIDEDTLVTFGPNGELLDPFTNYNYQAVNFLLTPQRRYQLGALGQYEINRHVEVFSRVGFTNTTQTEQLAPSSTFFDQYYINPDNPFLPPATIAAITQAGDDLGLGGPDGDGNLPFLAGRRMLEVGNRATEYTYDAYQVEAGLRGEIVGSWDYEFFVQHSQSDKQESYFNDINASRLQQGLLVVDTPDGLTCVDPSGGCVPVNIWSSVPGSLTPEAADYLRLNLQASGITKQDIVNLFARGDLGEGFKSPWADSLIGVILGYEYRDTSADYRTDDNLASGNAPGFGQTPPVSGEFDVNELYAEANVPIVEDRPWAKNLSLELGYRWSDYSTDVDTVSTYKAGLSWAPVDSTRFRGMYQRAVRAPNINELFQPQTESAETIEADPCGVGGDAGLSPDEIAELTALCIATGVAPGNVFGVAQPPAGQINGILGGNPELQEETSNTWTFGVILQPDAWGDFVTTIDYYNIEVEDAIEPLGGSGQALISGCYSETRDPNSVFCQAVQRSDAGLLFGQEAKVLLLNDNIGFLKTSGIDLTVSYLVDPDFMPGNLNFKFDGTYVIENEQQADPVTPVRDCAGTFGVTCLSPDPEFRFNFRTTWSIDEAQVSLRIRYLDGVTQDAIAFGDEAYSASKHIPSYTYFDLSGTYAFNEALTLTAGINNLFDRDPPVLDGDLIATPTTNGNGNTFPATYDALGQFLFVNATVQF